jgi:dipeptidyl aminopeptidase/acylaminoacyl peptidase
VAFSWDGKFLASASKDRSAKVWDRETGKELLTFQGHSSPVQNITFCPKGWRLATGEQDGQVQVWETATGKVLVSFRADQSDVQNLAFSPDGLRIASCAMAGTLRIWEAATGKELQAFEKQWDLCFDIAYSKDGKYLALAAGNVNKAGEPSRPPGEVKVWETATGKMLTSFTHHRNWVNSIAFSPDGAWVASADRDHVVKVWETVTGKEVHFLKGHTQPMVSVAFSPDGRRLATASTDGTVKLWEVETGQEVLVLKAEGVQHLAFSPDGKCLATAGKDGTVKLWEGTILAPPLRLRREALALLDDLFTTWVHPDEVAARLHQEPFLDGALRQAALAEVEGFRPNPVRLEDASYRTVRRPGAGVAAYQRALLQAAEACRLVPNHGYFLTTLGMAQYRAAQYQASVETLTRADKINTARLKVAYPGDLAFLAMGYYQLGDKDRALEVLGTLREIVSQPRWSRNGEVLAFLREAETLCEAPATRSK